MIFQVKKNDIEFSVMDSQNRQFWKLFYADWEKETFDIFDSFITKDSVVLDIGAWIGATTCYLAKKAKQVYAVEPDDDAYLEILNNCEVNSLTNVEINGSAIWKTGGGAVMCSRDGGFGNSMSTLILDEVERRHIPTTTFADFLLINRVRKFDFLKMDIEGSEYVIFPSFVKTIMELPYKPLLYISFHRELIGRSIFYSSEFMDIFKSSLKQLCDHYGMDYPETEQYIENSYSTIMFMPTFTLSLA